MDNEGQINQPLPQIPRRTFMKRAAGTVLIFGLGAVQAHAVPETTTCSGIPGTCEKEYFPEGSLLLNDVTRQCDGHLPCNLMNNETCANSWDKSKAATGGLGGQWCAEK